MWYSGYAQIKDSPGPKESIMLWSTECKGSDESKPSSERAPSWTEVCPCFLGSKMLAKKDEALKLTCFCWRTLTWLQGPWLSEQHLVHLFGSYLLLWQEGSSHCFAGWIKQTVWPCCCRSDAGTPLSADTSSNGQMVTFNISHLHSYEWVR